jgi:hypothetical protein
MLGIVCSTHHDFADCPHHVSADFKQRGAYIRKRGELILPIGWIRTVPKGVLGLYLTGVGLCTYREVGTLPSGE